MRPETGIEVTANGDRHRSGVSDLVGIALLSASGLALEIVLTRIFSVILPNHSAYVALGVALAGLGAGAAWATRDRTRPGTDLHLAALSMVAVLLATRWLPSAPYSLIYGSLWALPFFPLGRAAARLFADAPSDSQRLYAADMAGAGSGAVAAWGLLYAGPAAGVLGAAILALVSGEILASGRPGSVPTRVRFAVPTVILLASSAAVFSNAFQPLPIAPSPMKDQLRMTQISDGLRIASRWSPFGRTDLIDEGEGRLGIFVDGAAGTVMLDGERHWDPMSPGGMELAMSRGGVALRLTEETQRDSLLVIGAGGGRDVLMALQAGFRKVIAVEINPEIVRLDRRMGAFNGGLFEDDRVSLVQQEGRSYARSFPPGSIDVILLAMPLTKSSRAPYAYTLTENYLVTTQSLREYWERLTPEGELIVLGHGAEEMYRLILTSIRALEGPGLGVRDVLARTMVFSDPMQPVWILRRKPVGAALAETAHQILHPTPDFYYAPASWLPGLEDRAAPMMHQDGRIMLHSMLDPALGAVAEGRLTPGLLPGVLGIHGEIPTDQRPFFYKEEAGIPRAVRDTLVFGLVVAGLLLLSILGIRRRRQRRTGPGRTAGSFLAGLLLGAGYLMIEVALLQQWTRLLGHPSASTVLLLPLMLIGSAIGALLREKTLRIRPGFRGAVVGAAAMAGLTALFLPILLDGIAGWGSGLRYTAAAIVTLLVAVPLGIPFPLLLRRADRTGPGPGSVAAVWTGNAAGAVVGSALALAIAILAGLRWSLAAAGILYATILLLPLPLTGPSGPVHARSIRLEGDHAKASSPNRGR